MMNAPQPKRLLFINLVFLAFVWFMLFRRLHTEWIVNTLYSYGWFVPALAGYLFYERWRDRPPNAEKRPHPVWLIIPACFILAYAPIRIINEANPDWVKINFYFTGSVMLLSFAALFAMGRVRSMWHFAFPVLFCFTAMPWPVWMEENIVQTLTRLNTAISAETLTLCGTPAMAQGNLINVGGTWVNVAEACSGIRSLQTAFMMSLFLGEFYRLRLVLRALLMASSFVVVFALNVARTMTLTHIAGTSGSQVMEKWHDPLGTAVMVVGLAALWFLAVGFDKLQIRYFPLKPRTKTAAAVGSPALPAPFPLAFVVFGFVWFIGSEIATEAWYSRHEADLPPPAEWAVDWPTQAPDYKAGELPERTRAILKYNEGETASWKSPDGFNWNMYYIRWLPGRVSKFLSGAHYPTVCLPATGLKFIEETGRYECPVGRLEIPFNTYLFEAGREPVYVFHAIVEDQPANDGEKISYKQVNPDERFESVLRGHRNLGQRVLGISIMGPNSLQEAEASVHRVLSQILSTPQKTSLRR
ncbi:MAG: exosortase/archaeosortase family protein [Nibricoccus sp.]